MCEIKFSIPRDDIIKQLIKPYGPFVRFIHMLSPRRALCPGRRIVRRRSNNAPDSCFFHSPLLSAFSFFLSTAAADSVAAAVVVTAVGVLLCGLCVMLFFPRNTAEAFERFGREPTETIQLVAVPLLDLIWNRIRFFLV